MTRADKLKQEVEEGRTVVVSLRKAQQGDRQVIEWAEGLGLLVRVDRSGPWGNPYPLSNERDQAERAEVCRRYEVEHLASRPDLVDLIPTLRGKVLACWCSPRQCHGDTLARLANEVKA
jgi:hypothetical protein